MGSLSCYYWARMREQQRLVHNTFTKICFILLVNFVITIDSVNYWESRIRTRKRGKRKRGTEDETDITEQGTGACAPSQV